MGAMLFGVKAINHMGKKNIKTRPRREKLEQKHARQKRSPALTGRNRATHT